MKCRTCSVQCGGVQCSPVIANLLNADAYSNSFHR